MSRPAASVRHSRLEVEVDPNSKSSISYRSEYSPSSSRPAMELVDGRSNSESKISISVAEKTEDHTTMRPAPTPAESSRSWRSAWVFSGDEKQKSDAQKQWTILFIVSLLCLLLSIVSTATPSIYGIHSSSNSTATFRYGFYRACVMITPPGWTVNGTLYCGSYSDMEQYANASSITDFSVPDGLHASQVFSILAIVMLAILLVLLVLLVRSSRSRRILYFVFQLSGMAFLCTLLALLCVLQSSSSLVLMYGGAFEVFICVCTLLEACTTLLLIRRRENFAGICNTADKELESTLTTL